MLGRVKRDEHPHIRLHAALPSYGKTRFLVRNRLPYLSAELKGAPLLDPQSRDFVSASLRSIRNLADQSVKKELSRIDMVVPAMYLPLTGSRKKVDVL